MKRLLYTTSGTCSRQIEVITNGDNIESVKYYGGCNGNTQGVASLVKGMKIDEAIERLKGIKCGPRPTSCPDQLARALERIKEMPEE
ncbi:MAG: TIGR03905 family TSCPD domain-containing protein [Clostridia bacterium]|nr:TIGR03905 family TSCPD domain-containing protein [Clostridia bacterium]